MKESLPPALDKSREQITMLCLWTVFGILFVAGGVHGLYHSASACFGGSGCDRMTLSCSDSRRIFIFNVLYGRKVSSDTCSTNPKCDPPCCRPDPSDCFSSHTNYTFSLMYSNHKCWNSTTCHSQVTQDSAPCPGHSSLSLYAVAFYSCLDGNETTDFHRNITITAPAVAIHYNTLDETRYPVTMGNTQTWLCQVDTADCRMRQAEVILVKENESKDSNMCSRVGWSIGALLPCDKEFRYKSFNTSTPFYVRVKVIKNNRNPSGWAVVRAQDGSLLTVTCGYTENSIIPPCPVVPLSQTNPTTSIAVSTTTTTEAVAAAATTTHPNPTQRTSDSSGTSASSTTPSSGVLASSVFKSSTSQILTSTPANGLTSESVNASPANNSNKGAVAGGVVAALTVLVAVVLGVFFYLRRQRLKSGGGTNQSETEKSSMHMPLTSVTSDSLSLSLASESGIPTNLDDDDGDYDRIGQGLKPQNGHPTTPSIHVNSRSLVKDPDYDRLGEKKPQSSSSNPAATYGRLGDVGGGGEDTDYSYDHLARGRQAAPDAIDSDYDTSELHVTSEGDYDVAGTPRKQHVITGSDYDTAEIVTSEGDYNKVDFQGKKHYVITGSDYDTAEIVTSEGDYNKVNFQGRKQKVITGSDYDVAEVETSDDAESGDATPGPSIRVRVGGGDYDVAKPIVK